MPLMYIQIPAPITLTDGKTGKPLFSVEAGKEKQLDPIAFRDYVWAFMENVKWQKKPEQQAGVIEALESAADGVMQIAKDDWKAFKEIRDEDGIPFLPRIVYQLRPFSKAWDEAKETDPRKSTEVEKPAGA